MAHFHLDPCTALSRSDNNHEGFFSWPHGRRKHVCQTVQNLTMVDEVSTKDFPHLLWQNYHLLVLSLKELILKHIAMELLIQYLHGNQLWSSYTELIVDPLCEPVPWWQIVQRRHPCLLHSLHRTQWPLWCVHVHHHLVPQEPSVALNCCSFYGLSPHQVTLHVI